MLLDVTKEQFASLLKEALDSMNDRDYVEFVRKVADDAKLRGLNVVLDVRVNLRGRRSRDA